MIGPGRSWPCRREGSATQISNLRRPRRITAASQQQFGTPQKRPAEIPGIPETSPNKPAEALLGNDINELKRHGSAPRRLPETWRKLAEIGGNPLQTPFARAEGSIDTPDR
jgi:hypothetical protein